MGRQLLLLLAVFVGATAIALLVGAKNLGAALGAAQLCFAATLVYVLLRD
jgi:hypothetical protein